MIDANHPRQLLIGGAEYGGPLASKMVGRHLRELQRLSEAAVNNIKPAPAVTISPMYRVDGSISYWGKEGVERVRFTKKNQIVSLEAMIPELRWKGKTPYDIRKYLAGLMDEILDRSIDRIEKEKISFPSDAVLHAWRIARTEYLDPDALARVSALEWKDPTEHMEKALEVILRGPYGKTQETEPIRHALDELRDFKEHKRGPS